MTSIVYQELTIDQKDLVERFLSVFFDAENRKIFSWMMGTVVMNKPIYDENISRFFLLYSKTGGVGKSTIMRIIANGLFGPDYVATTPEFDTYFIAGDRFRSSNLSRKRVVIYDEAQFNGPLDKNRQHDFHGLNEDMIKAFATSGDLNIEEKFKQMKTTTFKNIHFILTNFLPVVPENRPDLGRRFLPCMLKPTKMQDKAKLLNNMTVEQMTEYVKANGQAFLNYFAHAYSDNPKCFDTYAYSHVNTAKQEQTAVDNEAKLEQAHELVSKQKDELQKLDAFALLNTLQDKLMIDVNDLLEDCATTLPSHDYLDRSTHAKVTYTQKQQSTIHYVVDTTNNSASLCVNTSKKAFSNYKNGDIIRDILLALYPKQKQFAQNVVKLPIHDYNQFVNHITSVQSHVLVCSCFLVAVATTCVGLVLDSLCSVGVISISSCLTTGLLSSCLTTGLLSSCLTICLLSSCLTTGLLSSCLTIGFLSSCLTTGLLSSCLTTGFLSSCSVGISNQ